MKYRFGQFELIPAARLLLRGGQPVTVPVRAFQCLVHLVEHRDRAVSRDELAEAVWKRSNVSDNQIAQAIAALRRLLGERGSEGPLLRTVPGFGYHWIGPVEVQAYDAGGTTGRPTPSAAQRNSAPAARHHLPWWAWLLIPAAAVCGTLLPRWPWFDSGGSTGGPRASVDAEPVWIIPAGMPDDPALAWARTALMALVGERLRGHDLPVVPVEHVLARYPDAGRSAAAGPDAAPRVVHTQVTRDGAWWRVALSLSDAANGDIVVHGSDRDLLVAAETAADALAHRLGAGTSAHADGADGRLASIRHTVRVGDFDSARTQLARLPANLRDSVQARLVEAQIDIEQGRTGAASERLAALWQRVQNSGSEAERCDVMLARIALARRLQQPDWQGEVQAAVELAERSGSPRLVARAVNLRGIARAATDDFAGAQQDFSRVGRIWSDLGDELGAADALANLGRLSPLLGDVAEAIDRLERSARVYRRYGAAALEFQALQSAAAIQVAALRWQEALASSDRARVLLPHVPDPSRRATFHRRRAWILAGLGRLREALERMDEADRLLADARADAATVARENLGRAQVLRQLGRLDEALVAAWNTFEALDDWHARDGYRSRRAMQGPDLALADWMDVRAAIHTARPGTRIDPDARLLAAIERGASPYALVARGDLQLEQGQVREAEASYREALREAERLNSLSRIQAASGALLRLRLAEGRLDEAGALVEAFHARAPDVVARDFESALLRLRLEHARGNATTWSAALERAMQLAGERSLPDDLLRPPAGQE